MVRFSVAVVAVASMFLLSGCAVRGGEAGLTGRRADLDGGWRFEKSEVKGGEVVGFDDGKWEEVKLPHTWNAKDGEDGGDNYYRGAGWYRRHLDLSAMDVKGKELYLRFEGASFKTDVYVNGKPAGKHNNMFGAFCFDVTGLVDASGDNVIAVRCDNSKDANETPISADFTFFGGMYRGVELLVKEPVCISPVDDAGPGVYVKQTDVSAESAKLAVTVKVQNKSGAAKDVGVAVVLNDASGKLVKREAVMAHVGAGATADSVVEMTVDHPHLWNGRKNPYMYQVVTGLSTDENHVVDTSEQGVGIRFFKVDPDKGFFLNGVSYPLHGVNRHQDRQDMGWAITAKEHKEDFDLIMEMGCTGIRLSHYQHAQEFYDLCDKGGLVVWAESCLVNAVTDSPEFTAAAQQQLQELIKQNYNHPSICFWSIYNELGNGNRNVSWWGIARQDGSQIILAKKLNEEVHELDDTRLSVAATSRGKPTHPLNLITDVIGFNKYSGWYSKSVKDWPRDLDEIHKGQAGRGVAISEYGAGAAITQHAYDAKQPTPTGKWHPEEFQMEVHEAAYGAMKDRPWIWGTFLWSMFDFAIDSRSEGDHNGRNDKGMVTYDRQVKKDVFYFYKANWSDEKFVYITDKRFTPRPIVPVKTHPDGTYPVKVYSNCESVELWVNGEDLGKMEAKDHVFVWPGAKWVEGKNVLKVVGVDGGKSFEDGCEIVVDPKVLPHVDPPAGAGRRGGRRGAGGQRGAATQGAGTQP